MSTHVAGFQSFFRWFFLHHYVLVKLASSNKRVKIHTPLNDANVYTKQKNRF